jgi:hypothetical protein
MTVSGKRLLFGTIACIGLGCAALAAAPAGSVTAAGVTLTSESVVLPGSTQLFPEPPGGPSAMPANTNCLTCHSADMVLNQPNLSKAAWHAVVLQMIAQYQAPIAASEVPAITDYLARIKGKP